jgi:glutathione S-transferase
MPILQPWSAGSMILFGATMSGSRHQRRTDGMLKLYLSPGSSSMAAHIALNEVGVPFEIHALSFAQKQTRAPEYLAINPEGKVPALLIDGRRLTEVAGILYYLARRYPEAKLWPTGGIEAEAQVISWMSFIASAVHPARAKGEEFAQQIWKLAEARLGNRTWAVGDSYTIADIHLFRLFWRYCGSVHPPRGTFPNLEAHYDRVMARPAVQKTIEAETAIGYNLP